MRGGKIAVLALAGVILFARAALAVAQGQGTTPSPEAVGEGVKVATEETFLQWMWRASGLIGVVIAAMSFYLIALVVWMGFQYRKSVVLPSVLIRDVTDLLGQ